MQSNHKKCLNVKTAEFATLLYPEYIERASSFSDGLITAGCWSRKEIDKKRCNIDASNQHISTFAAVGCASLESNRPKAIRRRMSSTEPLPEKMKGAHLRMFADYEEN